MSNDDIRVAWDYHNGTKHPDGPLLDQSWIYDRSMRPLLFKVYPDLTPIPLSLDASVRGVSALQAIAFIDSMADPSATVNLGLLTRLLYFSAGITKQIRYGPTGSIMPFRAAACTGALYHIELYVVCGDLSGLDAGVYHFDPQGTSLCQLRRGDYRHAVVEASGHEPAVEQAPAILIATDAMWRNAIKYQAREYRHAFWDSGTVLANTLALAATHRLPAKIITGFVDAWVSRLLDLDPRREQALALIPIGAAPNAGRSPAVPLDALNLAVQPVSAREIDQPAIRAMHAASALTTPDRVAAWRRSASCLQMQPSGSLIPLKPFVGEALPADPIEKVIVRRGSTRQFTRSPITFAQLSTVLHQSLQGIPADFSEPPGRMLTEVYLTVHAVDGLVPGAYVFQRDTWSLELLKSGDFRETSGYLGLEQDLPVDASANLFFLANLPPILECWGNRGYRAAQFDASLAAGRIYLAAYAQRFGATGLTFYDDAVIDFFSPHARGKSVMFLIALGHKAVHQPA
jgi:SagB-type dehydrogenase family enzyme